MNIFFDVDLTLISPFLELRPHARDVLAALKAEGHRLFLWSAGGKAYAEYIAERCRLQEFVEACFSKGEPLAVVPEFCVDDHPDFVTPCSGYLVRPYVGFFHRDEELLQVLHHIRSVAVSGDISGALR